MVKVKLLGVHTRPKGSVHLCEDSPSVEGGQLETGRGRCCFTITGTSVPCVVVPVKYLLREQSNPRQESGF